MTNIVRSSAKILGIGADGFVNGHLCGLQLTEGAQVRDPAARDNRVRAIFGSPIRIYIPICARLQKIWKKSPGIFRRRTLWTLEYYSLLRNYGFSARKPVLRDWSSA